MTDFYGLLKSLVEIYHYGGDLTIRHNVNICFDMVANIRHRMMYDFHEYFKKHRYALKIKHWSESDHTFVKSLPADYIKDVFVHFDPITAHNINHFLKSTYNHTQTETNVQEMAKTCIQLLMDADKFMNESDAYNAMGRLYGLEVVVLRIRKVLNQGSTNA